MTQPEARIVKAVQQTVAALGGHSVKTHGGMYGRAGTPDVLACIDGRMYALEVKTATGKASARQLHELRRWQRSGAVAAIARSEIDVRALASGASVDDVTMEVAPLPFPATGIIDEVFVREGAMTAGEVAALHARSPSTTVAPIPVRDAVGCRAEQDGVEYSCGACGSIHPNGTPCEVPR